VVGIRHFRIALGVLIVYPLVMCATGINKTPSRFVIEKSLREIETIKLPEIERLLVLCAQNSIAVDYEIIDYSVIKDFVEYIRDDMRHGDLERASYALNCLEEMCGSVLVSLNAYLDGTKKPWEITRYVTDPVEIQGGSVIGKAVNSVTGVQVTRPLFFTGYGHFDQIVKDMPKMTGYGVDILQTEVGPRDTVIERGYEYAINYAEIEKIENILRDAERNNVRVDVLLAPHYFPEWVLRKYPNLREDTGGFLIFNVYEPEAKKVIETHITAVMERIKDYKSLNSVCISNEPVFSTARNFNVNNRNSVVNVMWQCFLAETHGTINMLNDVYKSSYESFSAVPMPEGIEKTPLFFDWMTFNDFVFGDWHQWMADVIRKTAPDVPVHSKIMDAVLSPTGGSASLLWGIDVERFAQFSQFNGNDAYNLLFYDSGVTSKMKWYDFLVSMKKMPIFNSEDHIIEDRARDYIPQQVSHVRSDLWQGAVHGRTASAIWVWERTNDKASDFTGSILHRPDVVSAVGRTNLDLNRLAGELTALQNEPARAAILFSNPSRIYDEAYLSTVDIIYKSLIFNGIKHGFITEKQLAENVFGNYRMIIIPASVHVMPETLGAIKKFIESGMRVLIVGEESLSKDHYDRIITRAERDFIMENSTVLKNAESLTEQEISGVMRNFAAQTDFRGVTIRDSNSGNPVYGVEWLCAEYNGKLLINICNYEWESKSIAVFIEDHPAGNAMDLITGNAINADNMELPPFTPVLLSFDYEYLSQGHGGTEGQRN